MAKRNSDGMRVVGRVAWGAGDPGRDIDAGYDPERSPGRLADAAREEQVAAMVAAIKAKAAANREAGLARTALPPDPGEATAPVVEPEWCPRCNYRTRHCKCN
jgi:hypothetical protein